MSMFLVYFEHEHATSVTSPTVLPPLHASPLRVTTNRTDRQPVHALAIHDGVAADRFFAEGASVVGRAGEQLRAAFVRFIEVRIDAGAKPAFVFHWFNGPVDHVDVDWTQRTRMRLDELDQRLAHAGLDAITQITPNT